VEGEGPVRDMGVRKLEVSFVLWGHSRRQGRKDGDTLKGGLLQVRTHRSEGGRFKFNYGTGENCL